MILFQVVFYGEYVIIMNICIETILLSHAVELHSTCVSRHIA